MNPILKQNNPRRVAVYCRVSTLSESQEESFETQCAYYEKRIATDPTLTLAGIYGDQGISGKSAERPEFQRMLTDCKNGKIDMVMTKSISRFTRNLADCLETVRYLRTLGTPVIFEREGIDTMERDGEFLLTVLASIAQEEINSMSQNIRWAHEHYNSKGDPCRAPSYGYRMRIENGRHIWSICEPEAKRVRYAFREAALGQKYSRIVEGLNEIEEEERTGATWSRKRLSYMLKNEVYTGDIITNKHVTLDYLSGRSVKNTGQCHQYFIEGHHEPIISKEEFRLVGKRFKQRTKNTEIA